MNMTEALRRKYGDEIILGVEKSIVDGRLQSGYTPFQNPTNDSVPLLRLLADHLQPRLRREAEQDASFKQLIPYVLVRNASNGHIYATTRLGGDRRLVGQMSIGLGGHMEAGESFVTCLLRELKEEIGLTEGDVVALRFLGFLFSESCDVDSVHLGLVYELETFRSDVICLETDK